jgi:ubiquinone/menaquinone biosynthesis C-methylase UbiE
MATQSEAQKPGLGDTTYSTMGKLFARRNSTVHAAHLVPHLKPHYSILDVGCGNGSITVDLARRVPEGRVVGVDLNEGSSLQSMLPT